MAEERTGSERPEAGKKADEARRRRLAEAMRANLRRRKDQAHAQAKARDLPSKEETGSG